MQDTSRRARFIPNDEVEEQYVPVIPPSPKQKKKRRRRRKKRTGLAPRYLNQTLVMATRARVASRLGMEAGYFSVTADPPPAATMSATEHQFLPPAPALSSEEYFLSMSKGLGTSGLGAAADTHLETLRRRAIREWRTAKSIDHLGAIHQYADGIGGVSHSPLSRSGTPLRGRIRPSSASPLRTFR